MKLSDISSPFILLNLSFENYTDMHTQEENEVLI